MQRLVGFATVVLLSAFTATSADGQFRFGVQGSYVASGFDDLAGIPGPGDDLDLSGTAGLGGRVAFAPSALPVTLYGSATWFFPSCDAAKCSYLTGGIGAQAGITPSKTS